MLWLIGRKCAGKARNLPATLLNHRRCGTVFALGACAALHVYLPFYFASVPFIIWAICYFVSEHILKTRTLRDAKN
jgi:integral membrane sensor domain MASE1